MSFCEKCGFEIDKDALYCEKCGTAVKSGRSNSQEGAVSQSVHGNASEYLKGRRKYIVILAGILLVICVASFWGSGSREYINTVKQGRNEYYDQVTTGEAFQSFFSKVKWKYNTKTKLVEVEGGCLYGGIPAKAKMEYYVYDNGVYELKSVSLDDGYGEEFLSERQIISLFSDAYESAYQKKGLEPPANLGNALDSLDMFMDFFSY